MVDDEQDDNSVREQEDATVFDMLFNICYSIGCGLPDEGNGPEKRPKEGCCP